MKGPQWWLNSLGRWESLGKGRISGTPPIHPNCQCRLVSMEEWLEIRRKELVWALRDKNVKEVCIPIGGWGPEYIKYFKSERKKILDNLRAFRQMQKLIEREERKKRKAQERLHKKNARVEEQMKAKTPKKKIGWGRKVASVALDFIPLVGVAKGVSEFVRGVDPVTGEKVGRLAAGVSLAIGIVPIPGMRVVGKFAGRMIVHCTSKGFKSSRRASKALKGRVGKGKRIGDRNLGSSARELKRLDKARVDYWISNVNLKVEERMKSHVLRDHVGKTYKEMSARLKKKAKDIEMVSSFRSAEEAQAHVQRVLHFNRKAIKKWIKHDPEGHTANFTSVFKNSAGYGIDRTGKRYDNLKKVTVVLHKRKDNLRIVTAYAGK